MLAERFPQTENIKKVKEFPFHQMKMFSKVAVLRAKIQRTHPHAKWHENEMKS